MNNLEPVITKIERFVEGREISVRHANEIEGELAELFDHYDDEIIDDFIYSLAFYRPEGGDCLYDFKRFQPIAKTALNQLKGVHMTITRMETQKRMSRIVIHNNTIYLCGQVAEDASKGIKEQTETMLAKVDTLLAQAGSDREHILSATIYIKSMEYFAEMNEIWDNWIPESHAPARACVEASMARDALLVEISVIAAVVK